MLDTYEKHSKLKLIATVLSVAVIAGCVVFVDHLKASSATATTSTGPTTTTAQAVATTSPTTDVTPSVAATTASNYKDGTYSATSGYYVPHGNETIRVNLTVANGVISAAAVQNSESDRESAQYQQDFASVFKSYVVGKKISGLKLGVVAGASDTTQGFNDALSQIATKARA